MSKSSWIWQEAKRLAERTKDKEIVVFECGFGASGLPHIGTFAEVARTSMVRKAFVKLTGKRTRLIVFSDDMDALRKVPENVPNQEMLAEHIGVPVCHVPCPFGSEHLSFAGYNNAKLREFLDQYGFDYEFLSSWDCYTSGTFNDTIVEIARHADAIKKIVTKGYGPERIESYCPFLPIMDDGVIYQNVYNWAAQADGLPTAFMTWFLDKESSEGSTHDDRRFAVTHLNDGQVKCQWKVDWPMRWMALGVDYEMHGKDLIDSARVGQEICKLVGHPGPMTYMYELFLDEAGEKVSKSRGNGFEFDQWIRYSNPESLQWFLYQNPRKSRMLQWNVVPASTDAYLKELGAGYDENTACWAIHGDGQPPASPVSYSMLLNLVSITDTTDPEAVLKYVAKYCEGKSVDVADFYGLMPLIEGAINYYSDHVLPVKEYRRPTFDEMMALRYLITMIEGKVTAEEIQYEAYEVGKIFYGEGSELRNFFTMIYQVLMGQDSGPRFGQFVEITGVDIIIDRIRSLWYK